VDQTDQGLGAVWREKSFGQRLKFRAGGGKFVPLGLRTIFLDRPKRPTHLPIIRKSQNYDLIMQNKPNFLKDKTNATLFATKDYENETAFRLQKNKPNQSQS